MSRFDISGRERVVPEEQPDPSDLFSLKEMRDGFGPSPFPRLVADAISVDRAHPGRDQAASVEEKPGGVGVELTENDLREIEEASSSLKLEGARLPEDVLRRRGAEQSPVL